MDTRMNWPQVAPRQLTAMLALEHSVDFDEQLLNLVKLRASQINGCAMCIDTHWKDARAGGESEERLYALDAWRGTPLQRRGTRRAGAVRGDDVDRRFARARFHVERRCGRLLRGRPGPTRRCHRHRQRLEPLEHRDPAPARALPGPHEPVNPVPLRDERSHVMTRPRAQPVPGHGGDPMRRRRRARNAGRRGRAVWWATVPAPSARPARCRPWPPSS